MIKVRLVDDEKSISSFIEHSPELILQHFPNLRTYDIAQWLQANYPQTSTKHVIPNRDDEFLRDVIKDIEFGQIKMNLSATCKLLRQELLKDPALDLAMKIFYDGYLQYNTKYLALVESIEKSKPSPSINKSKCCILQ